MAKNSFIFLGCILAVFLAFSGCTQSETGTQVPADNKITVPDTAIIWNDTCTAFECMNETGYTETMEKPFRLIAANETENTDFSNQTLSAAFLSLNNLFKEKYAFTEWRDVDFDKLYNNYAPAVKAAEDEQDNAAYYRALREYLYSIPDGHIAVMPLESEFGARDADIGGGFGIGITQLDSGKVIVSYVADGSEAQNAGIKFGDEILEWNQKEIHEAINETPYIWAVKKPSTSEGILLARQRFLTRAPVGTTAEILLAGSSGSNPPTVNLTAFDDGYDSVRKTSYFLGKEVNDYGTWRIWEELVPQMSNSTITSKELPDGYLYIAIYGESYDIYQEFKKAMLSAISDNAPGIVIDLRFNSGGDDALGSCLAAWFVNEPLFFEYTTKYDAGLKNFTITSEAWTYPQSQRYEGPVAVMVSTDTISSGEAVPMIFKKTGRGKIISFYGTNGAFGMNTIQAAMPLGMYIFFPDGASLDENGIIQIDSNAELIGGISPDIRVPLNEDTVSRAMAGEDVQLTYALDWLKEQQNTTKA